MDAEGRIRQAQADLTAAQADLVQQQSALRLAEFNRDAYGRLAKTGAASQLQGLQAEVQADQQAALVAASQRKVEAARPPAAFYAPGPIVQAEITRPAHPVFYGYTEKEQPVRWANGPPISRNSSTLGSPSTKPSIHVRSSGCGSPRYWPCVK